MFMLRRERERLKTTGHGAGVLKEMHRWTTGAFIDLVRAGKLRKDRKGKYRLGPWKPPASP